MAARDVLVVDDTRDCLVILRSMLEGSGFEVRTAQSGADALAQIEERIPDVVLLDVMMPGMSGLEVVERLRADHATARIPVILVTARSDDDDVMAGYRAGADYYITKPCTMQEVLRGIALVVGGVEETSLGAGAAGSNERKRFGDSLSSSRSV